MPTLYGPGDSERVAEPAKPQVEAFRSPWRRDLARLIHCPSFRRLQGKTQVFPGHESDFYRNRLSHSMEVAQIAKSIAIKLNATSATFAAADQKIEPDLVEFAALAHDLGHPPFGHNGEEALDECMSEHGGFEGNGQTLRIISRLEKKATLRLSSDGELRAFDADGTDLRLGLGLTYRALASVLKYDRAIPERSEDRSKSGVVKGYYKDDTALVANIKQKVLGVDTYDGPFKTIECSIMDIADDIAYSTYDLEDNFKAGFLDPLGLFTLDNETYEAVVDTINSRIDSYYPEYSKSKIDVSDVHSTLYFILADLLFVPSDDDLKLFRSRRHAEGAKKMLLAMDVQARSRKIAQNGYVRADFTSRLVQFCLDGIEVIEHPIYPQLHRARLDFETFRVVEILKNLTYHAVIRAPSLQVVEYRGKDIVKSIFKALVEDDGIRLLPEDFRSMCASAPVMVKYRTICDFIAGMTDRYAFEFYNRLHGAVSTTVHKPF
ncbi:deoxyguanosinetriphosphate triphosphohydrolase [Microvirga sp. KLBC 81]|uniref:dGTP triphosphohydrolase n=1 Tax=Microvirga sp. KLBC 81 TaxID=1862707 RepID=UPI000D51CA0C|nr:dNTP triphosphohydrolase [Microvirga sp. KLBC 81]PVE23163.1 deoxyguanosinetriphosphate triphosphohydrolase [Microvirga sp. KLBC 81]